MENEERQSALGSVGDITDAQPDVRRAEKRMQMKLADHFLLRIIDLSNTARKIIV